MAGVLAAIRSGPGILLSWPTTPDATSFHISAARFPSPSFYELEQGCCPLLPTFIRPCCPVRAGSTSLQIQGLDAGVQYKFRVAAESASNSSLGDSDWIRVAAVPHAPGSPVLRHVTSDAGAIYDVTWEPPSDDGGDLIRGYRLEADITSLNRTGVVLVANTSARRPLSEAMMISHARHLRLPLLPSHTYQLRVRALNTVGAGALSPPLALRAPVGPPAEFELPICAWRRGRVGRGLVVRHRVFIPPATLSARVVVQQVATRACCASLDERQELTREGELALYVHAGAAPQDVPTLRAGRSHPDPLGERVVSPMMPNPYADVAQLGAVRASGRVNASASDGELSLALEYPETQWVHVLIHGGQIESDGIEYDVRVETVSGVDGVIGSGLDTAGCVGEACARHDNLEGIGWRYRLDPDGASRLDDYVLGRHLHPMSLRGELREPVQTWPVDSNPIEG